MHTRISRVHVHDHVHVHMCSMAMGCQPRLWSKIRTSLSKDTSPILRANAFSRRIRARAERAHAIRHDTVRGLRFIPVAFSDLRLRRRPWGVVHGAPYHLALRSASACRSASRVTGPRIDRPPRKHRRAPPRIGTPSDAPPPRAAFCAARAPSWTPSCSSARRRRAASRGWGP